MHRESLRAAVTSNPAEVLPVLFWDWNANPEDDGTYYCLPHEFLPVEKGSRVMFGSDDIYVPGVVLSLDPRGLVWVRADV